MADQSIVGDDAALITPADGAMPVPSCEVDEILNLGNGIVLSLKTDALLIQGSSLPESWAGECGD